MAGAEAAAAPSRAQLAIRERLQNFVGDPTLEHIASRASAVLFVFGMLTIDTRRLSAPLLVGGFSCLAGRVALQARPSNHSRIAFAPQRRQWGVAANFPIVHNNTHT